MKAMVLLLFILISYAACDVKLSVSDKSMNVPLNQDFTIKCIVTSPDVFERWYNPALSTSIEENPKIKYSKNNNEHSLTVTMDISVAGVWTCYSKQGNNVSIAFEVPPSIITPIDPRQYLIKDQPGAVVVDIRGYPPPDYVWKKDGTDLNITGRYSIASNGTLLISMVQTGDNGTYILTASKSIFHANSGDIVVTLRVAPTIDGTSIQERRTKGGNISFECSASGVPKPDITWKKDSKVINNDGRFIITASGLFIKDIETDDVGAYTCVANNSVGTKMLTSTLQAVHVPPEIIPFRNEQEVAKGKTLTVNCNATGSPVPTVEWSKDGNIIPTSQQTKSSGKSVLTLTNIQTDQDGVYECSAMNAAVDEMGNIIVKKKSIKVNVVYPPEFQNFKDTINVRLNDPVTITCNAIGIPRPDVKLVYGNKELQASTANSSSLLYHINKTTTDELGVYTCTASNKLGTIREDVKLIIPLDKPEINISDTKCNAVNFSWHHDTQNYVAIKSYEVKLIRSEDQKAAKIEKVDENVTFPVHFGDLDENTDYELLVVQKTEDVKIGLNATKKIRTPKCPLEKITHIVEGNRVTISWRDYKSAVDKYIVKYRIKESLGDWMKNETHRVFIQFSDLTRGETYEFEVFYEKAGNEVPYTEIKEILIPFVATITTIPSRPSSRTSHTQRNVSTTTENRESTTESATVKSPGKVARNKGLSGGAIAAIVIVIILLVLIAVDIFCCFFNQCGVVHMCAAACAGKKREKYNVDGSPDEGTQLKKVDEDGKDDPEA